MTGEGHACLSVFALLLADSLYSRFCSPRAPQPIETLWWLVYVFSAPLLFSSKSSLFHTIALILSLYSTRFAVEALHSARTHWAVRVASTATFKTTSTKNPLRRSDAGTGAGAGAAAPPIHHLLSPQLLPLLSCNNPSYPLFDAGEDSYCNDNRLKNKNKKNATGTQGLAPLIASHRTHASRFPWPVWPSYSLSSSFSSSSASSTITTQQTISLHGGDFADMFGDLDPTHTTPMGVVFEVDDDDDHYHKPLCPATTDAMQFAVARNRPDNENDDDDEDGDDDNAVPGFQWDSPDDENITDDDDGDDELLHDQWHGLPVQCEGTHAPSDDLHVPERKTHPTSANATTHHPSSPTRACGVVHYRRRPSPQHHRRGFDYPEMRWTSSQCVAARQAENVAPVLYTSDIPKTSRGRKIHQQPVNEDALHSSESQPISTRISPLRRGACSSPSRAT